MEWADHDRWAERMDIPNGVSRDVNRIVDAIEQGNNLPQEYEEHLADCVSESDMEKPKKGGSALDMVVEDYTKREHDVGRGPKTGHSLAAEFQRCAVERMGPKYLQCWFLHHHLDYLSENRNSEKDFEQLLAEFREEHPEVHSQEIEDFLVEHRAELVDELNLES